MPTVQVPCRPWTDGSGSEEKQARGVRKKGCWGFNGFKLGRLQDIVTTEKDFKNQQEPDQGVG